MSKVEIIFLLENKFLLNNEQVIKLQNLPDDWWHKCAKAINISKIKGYDLIIDINDFLKEESTKPRAGFIHKYIVNTKTQDYTHIKSVKIKI